MTEREGQGGDRRVIFVRTKTEPEGVETRRGCLRRKRAGEEPSGSDMKKRCFSSTVNPARSRTRCKQRGVFVPLVTVSSDLPARLYAQILTSNPRELNPSFFPFSPLAGLTTIMRHNIEASLARALVSQTIRML